MLRRAQKRMLVYGFFALVLAVFVFLAWRFSPSFSSSAASKQEQQLLQTEKTDATAANDQNPDIQQSAMQPQNKKASVLHAKKPLTRSSAAARFGLKRQKTAPPSSSLSSDEDQVPPSPARKTQTETALQAQILELNKKVLALEALNREAVATNEHLSVEVQRHRHFEIECKELGEFLKRINERTNIVTFNTFTDHKLGCTCTDCDLAMKIASNVYRLSLIHI